MLRARPGQRRSSAKNPLHDLLLMLQDRREGDWPDWPRVRIDPFRACHPIIGRLAYAQVHPARERSLAEAQACNQIAGAKEFLARGPCRRNCQGGNSHPLKKEF
jgi:hypothetical protein